MTINVSSESTGAIIFAVILQTIAAGMSWWQSWMAKHSAIKAVAKVDSLHVEVNHKMDELLVQAKAAALAQGILEGIEQQKRRVSTGDTGQPDVTPPTDSK